ncbi:MAG TPA: hypothetical protein DCX22_04410 [Dehalococcoidia bacterium]|nr:hypothetical protein [Dehalococcoidia bacterium]
MIRFLSAASNCSLPLLSSVLAASFIGLDIPISFLPTIFRAQEIINLLFLYLLYNDIKIGDTIASPISTILC